ncbi:DNA repair protein RecN [Chloroflexota bacterium]
MLLELRIRDFGIIEDMNWSLSSGLNVITGETGAGKSLVIDAMEALLSGKIDEENIRHGANETHIEGVFTLSNKENDAPQLRTLLLDNGLATDDGTLVISCEYHRQGRSVARVNRHMVPRGLLYQIGCLLIDIYGQSEHQSLLKTEYHLDFLDSYAHALDLRCNFGTKISALYQTEHELESLEKEGKEIADHEELLRFQIDEIGQAKLQEGEEAELEQERNIISSSEKLKASSYKIYNTLFGEDISSHSASALEILNEAVHAMGKLVELDPTLRKQLNNLERTVPELEEIARDIHSYANRMEYDPKRLEEIELRLELIRNLKRKYGQGITEILEYLQKAEKELDKLSYSLDKSAELKQLHNSIKQELGHIAFELSQVRTRAAKTLAVKIRKELRDLKMSQIQFEVSIKQKHIQKEGIPLPNGNNYAFGKGGVDTVEFMASTNPGEPIKPLAKIASTGEISRFMLALKGVLSKTDNIPILVFDEIDIGVGGRWSEIIGEKLWALAQNRQVICVTHLPQIAVFADTHHSISKKIYGTRTLSTLESLQGKSRIEELVAMLAGSQYTEASVNNISELAHKTELWKETYLSNPGGSSR